MSFDDVQNFPRHGDIRGDPNLGHRVDVIHAAIVIFADGSEGLASQWSFDANGEPVGRVTLVTSDPKILPKMREMLARLAPPPGGRFEWREYRHAG